MPAATTAVTRPFRREGSNGEAVVLVHGFTGHPGHWELLAGEIAERGYTVTAPLLPGHGGGPAELAAATADDWIAATRAAAREVAGHRRVHLVGLSMGGMLAVLAARASGAASLTLINTPVVLRNRRMALAPLARPLRETVTTEPLPAPDPELAHLWRPLDAYPTAALVELRRVVARGWREAGRLRRRTLVVQSATDEIVDPRSGPMLAKRLGGRHEWLTLCRHNALLDPARPHLHRLVLAHITADAPQAAAPRLA